MKDTLPYKENYDEDRWDSQALPLDASLFDAFPAMVVWNGKIFQKKNGLMEIIGG